MSTIYQCWCPDDDGEKVLRRAYDSRDAAARFAEERWNYLSPDYPQVQRVHVQEVGVETTWVYDVETEARPHFVARKVS